MEAKVIEMPQPKTGNAIFEIIPYKTLTGWSFDDDKRDISGEPFVAGADTFLDRLAGEGATKVGVRFSAKAFRDYQFSISKVAGSINEGTDYFSEAFQHDLWLCPALGKYFSESPDVIFLQIIPIKND